MGKNIAVIGAGVGGLSAAARLAKRGCNVTIYEKLARCGGRANIIEDKGFKFDTGPSFVLMPDFYQEVFEYCGEKMDDYLRLKALDISYNIFYANGKQLTIYRDSEETKRQMEKIEQGSAARYDEFLTDVKEIYDSVRGLLYRSFGLKDIADYRYWPLLFKLKPWKSYWDLARKYFKSEELAYAFTFEAMFIGVSPFNAPAFYSMITYVDHVQKIFHPMGGMYQIPLALERMAKKFGAKAHYNSAVTKVTPDGKGWVVESPAGTMHADAVVANADYAYTKKELLGDELPDYEYSCSVLLFYWGLKAKVQGLAHHNLFFAKDLTGNLRDIFNTGKIPIDGSFYIHTPTVTDLFLAPEGKDIVYVLVPVPNLKLCRQNISEAEEAVKKSVIDVVKELIGVDLATLIEVEHRFYPSDFISRYNILWGATFGLSHSLKQSAFFRPGNADARYNGFYYTGASTQPGGGLPPVIASSKIAADMILKR